MAASDASSGEDFQALIGTIDRRHAKNLADDLADAASSYGGSLHTGHYPYEIP